MQGIKEDETWHPAFDWTELKAKFYVGAHS